MASAVFKFCNKCGSSTSHRYVKTGDYYRCSVCAENASKKYRKANWCRYLAQRANGRKRPGSEKITELMVLQIAEYQNFKCALTGIPFDVESKWWKPSLDRIDSSQGYSRNNLRLVAWIVNHTRGDLTDSEFINMCNRVASNFHKYPYAEFSVLSDANG